MSSLRFDEIEHVAMQFGISGDFGTYCVTSTPEAESNKFKQMPPAAPRTSRVEAFLAAAVNLKNLAIIWVKEKLPQKLAIFKFDIAQKNAANALKKSLASENFGDQVERFKEFLKFDIALMDMWKNDSHLPEEIINKYIENVRQVVSQDFAKFDSLVSTLYDTCTGFYTTAKVLKELVPVHQSLCRFLQCYGKSGEYQKTVFNQSRYCEFNA